MTVTEQEIFSSMNEIGEQEGMLISAEGAAVWAATKQLVKGKQDNKNTKTLILVQAVDLSSKVADFSPLCKSVNHIRTKAH